MKKIILLSGILLGVALLSGCTILGQPVGESSAPKSSNTTKQAPAANEKVGETSKTGTISSSNGAYFITEPGKQPETIDSYAVDLSAYVGQTVTITGQFSGDTLFVGEVK